MITRESPGPQGFVLTTFVIHATLLTAMNTTHCHSVDLVEMRNRFGVLSFPVLDHQPLAG